MYYSSSLISIVVGAALLLPTAASADARPPPGHKFLSLPFDDENVRITTGWYYDPDDPYLITSCDKIANVALDKRHCGIDFAKNGEPFAVRAAASGGACWGTDEENGNYVIVKHDEKELNNNFRTFYGHLAEKTVNGKIVPQINETITRCDDDSTPNTPLKRGMYIGKAGNTGIADGIHLHFAVLLGKRDEGRRLDPYDIANSLNTGAAPTHIYYPGNASGTSEVRPCGTNNLWLTCPPPPLECKNEYDSTDGVPENFGVPWNVLSRSRELLLRASCEAGGTEFNVGNGSSNQYIYRTGYVYDAKAESWQETKFSGEAVSGSSDWLVGKASYKFTPTPEMEYKDGNIYFVAYLCTWTGVQWKCGCRNKTCAQNFWQLQAFRWD